MESHLDVFDVIDHLVRLKHFDDQHESSNHFAYRCLLMGIRNARVMRACRMQAQKVGIV